MFVVWRKGEQPLLTLGRSADTRGAEGEGASMVVIALVGPSHAGKSKLTETILAEPCQQGLDCAPEVLDLDESLGSSHRSDGTRAIELVRSCAGAGHKLVLVNVGAGQIVDPAFRAFVLNESGVTPVAVWCDESTFRSRHSRETADREFQNNFTAELTALWEELRARSQLVDTSRPRTVEESAQDLVRIMGRVASAQEAPGRTSANTT